VFQGKGTQEARDQILELTTMRAQAVARDQLGLIPVVELLLHRLAVMVGRVKYRVLQDRKLCTLAVVVVALIPLQTLVGLGLQAVVMGQVLMEQAQVKAQAHWQTLAQVEEVTQTELEVVGQAALEL
jgi:hypothetical protein